MNLVVFTNTHTDVHFEVTKIKKSQTNESSKIKVMLTTRDSKIFREGQQSYWSIQDFILHFHGQV